MFAEKNMINGVMPAEINAKELEFEPLKAMINKNLVVNGFFFSTGRFGEQVVIIATDEDGVIHKLNMPKRACDTFKGIVEKDEEKKAVLDGHCGINNIRMIDTKNGTTVAYDFIDR